MKGAKLTSVVVRCDKLPACVVVVMIKQIGRPPVALFMQSTTNKIVLRSHKKGLPIVNKIRDFVIRLIEKINTRSLSFVFFASPLPPPFKRLPRTPR